MVAAAERLLFLLGHVARATPAEVEQVRCRTDSTKLVRKESLQDRFAGGKESLQDRFDKASARKRIDKDGFELSLG